jgi:hypothetical protein
MRHVLNLFVMVLVVAGATTAGATTWQVAPGGGGDATTIQGGINLAANGDIVSVAPGTYTGVGNRNVTFSGKNITVQSQAGPLFTVIDCQNLGNGFNFLTGETTTAVLDGFTIKNGQANKGGGIQIDTASPTIRYCVISNCLANAAGGGIYVKKGDPQIYCNTIDGNNCAIVAQGGGITLGAQSHAKLWQNIVCNSVGGGAIGCSGAMAGTAMSCNDLYANVGGDAVCFGTTNNFSLDPLYCGIPGSGNFFLQQTSPCAVALSPCAAAVGALGVQCQVTATEGVSWGKVKSMYR